MNKPIFKKLTPTMHFERSSGFAGYRCAKCNTWEYAENVGNHKCPSNRAKVAKAENLFAKAVKAPSKRNVLAGPLATHRVYPVEQTYVHQDFHFWSLNAFKKLILQCKDNPMLNAATVKKDILHDVETVTSITFNTTPKLTIILDSVKCVNGKFVQIHKSLSLNGENNFWNAKFQGAAINELAEAIHIYRVIEALDNYRSSLKMIVEA